MKNKTQVINGNYSEYKLDNGLVVALQNTPTQTISAKLRVNYGSSHEEEGEEGLAHYLEHCLVTGGSEKHDPITADGIRESFGYFNANTGIGRTNQLGQMVPEDLDSWLDYVSNHVLRPRFDKERINGEKERVLREISDAKSNPAYSDQILFDKILYRGHPKGIFNLGKEDVVRNADQEVMRAFHDKGYHPNNMDLILVGGLPDDIEDMVEKYFGSFSKGRNSRKEFPELKPLEEKTILRMPAPERINVDNPQESSAEIFLRFLGPVNGHEDECATRTMSHILGRGSSSRLFKNLGLEKGLAYEVGTSTSGNYNAGEFGVSASVPSNRVDEAVDSIFEEMARMKTQRLDDGVIEKVKKRVKYDIATTFESNDEYISAIEKKLDLGLTLEMTMEGYNKVTPEKVMEVANKYIPDKEKGKYILYIRDPLGKQDE